MRRKRKVAVQKKNFEKNKGGGGGGGGKEGLCGCMCVWLGEGLWRVEDKLRDRKIGRQRNREHDCI